MSKNDTDGVPKRAANRWKTEEYTNTSSMEKVLNCTKEGIIIYGSEFIVSFANSAVCDIFGSSRSEVVGKSMMDIFETPKERELIRNICEDCIKGNCYQYEMDITGNDGKRKTILGSGAPILEDDGTFLSAISSFIDITERKRYERELERLKSFNEDLMGNIPSGIAALDKNLNIIFANKSFCSFMKTSTESIVGEYISNVLPYQLLCKKRLILNIFDVLDNGGIKSIDQLRLAGDEETIINIEIRGFEEDNASGVSVMLIINDLTLFHKLRETLEKSRRMESIGRLAGGIAHHFNNVLGSIMGYASLLQTSTERGSEFYTYLDKILQSAERASQQTNQLLSMAVTRNSYSSIFDPIQLVEDTRRLLISTLGKKFKVTTYIDPDTAKIRGNENNLQQCILDLCLNARDTMGDGGVLNISTGNAHIGENFRMENTDAEAGQYVLISITDSGTGIWEDQSIKDFELFSPENGEPKEWGLILSAGYDAVKEMGGFIFAGGKQREGIDFRIYIPAAGEVNKSKQKYSVQDLKGGSERVMVVEDNTMMSSVMTEILSSAGYRIECVDNGAEAVNLFSNEAERFDLVILDLDLPTLGGWKTFEKIREISKDIPVVFSTAYSKTYLSENILNERCTKYIQKPFTMSDILGLVRKMFDSNILTISGERNSNT